MGGWWCFVVRPTVKKHVARRVGFEEWQDHGERGEDKGGGWEVTAVE